MSTELISVVIPVYKVEQYLKTCVESILKQTYTNLEIILVDDGSPDKCPEICDEFAKQDARVRVIHKENEGLAEARNVGIEAASGKYITFVDSDDSVDFSMIEALYHALKKNHVLVSVCGFEKIKRQKLLCSSSIAKAKVKDSVDFLYETRQWFAWGKLYDARLFRKRRFIKGQLSEDIFLIPRLLMDCEKIAVVQNKPLYFYLQRTNSIMGNAREVIYSDYSRNLLFMLEYAKRKYGEETDAYKKLLVSAIRGCFNRLIKLEGHNYRESKEFIVIFRYMIIKNIKNVWANNFMTLREKLNSFILLISVALSVRRWNK